MFTEILNVDPSVSFGFSRQVKKTEVVHDDYEAAGRSSKVGTEEIVAPKLPIRGYQRSTERLVPFAPDIRKDSVRGVVQKIDDHFVSVKAVTTNGTLDMNIPKVLCPQDVQYEGTAVEIAVGTSGGYSGLQVSKRESACLPKDISDSIASVLDWADSL